MRFLIITTAALLVASIAAAQATRPPAQDKTFDFANRPSPQGLQEVATVLRTVGDLQYVAVDAAAATVTVTGNVDQLAMAGWMIHELDQPSGIASAPTDQYLVSSGAAGFPRPGSPGAGDDVIRVFFLQHTNTSQGVQEILTVLRTVADVQKVFSYSAPFALVARGPAAQIALSAYMIHALDVTPGSATSSPEYQYQPPGGRTQVTNSVVRVYYLANAKTPQQIQEMLTVLRTVADIQKIFNVSAIRALAIRGTASEIATSEWIIQSLDIPPIPKDGIREFTIPENLPNGNLIRVFYPANISTPQKMQQTLTLLRTKLQIMKVFTYTSLPAVVVRGAADQIANAEQLIQEQDQLARTTP
jgi:hypothetical protein